MENVVFDVAEVNLPFNAIIGRPALYRFMAIAHYGYLALYRREDASTSGTKVPPRHQRYDHPERMVSPSKPSCSLRIPPRPLALRVIWTRNRNSRSSLSSRQMPTCSHGSRRRCLGSPGR
jgi:hypothetical protein